MGIEGYYEDYFDDRQEKEKLTNFQKIKNMGLDEMAEEFYMHLGKCTACAMFFKCEKHHMGKHKCIKMYKQWLQKEREG